MSSARPPSGKGRAPSRAESVAPPDYKPGKPSKMMNIQSLLNPSTSVNQRLNDTDDDLRSPSTKTYTTRDSPTPSTPATTSSSKGQKLAKDSAVFTRSSPRSQVNFPPFEAHERPICLSKAELAGYHRKHKLFKITPSGTDELGLIGDNTRHIPYSSDKKSFFGKTGRDGFNVFQYTFHVPGATDGKEYVVMWDYENGLVRITPFFKACKFSKTTPAKALTTNAGLKDLAYSITGGALAAQGYWLPYQCARAICLTFCYNIRWAVVPVFGWSFLRDCLPPNHVDYGKFKISTELVRCAQLEADGWRPSPKSSDPSKNIPRSTPQDLDGAQNKALRSRPSRPKFKNGSPFTSDADASEDAKEYESRSYINETPDISPKTSLHGFAGAAGWTSINRFRSPPSPPNNSPVDSLLSHSLLTQPRYASWRPANPVDSSSSGILRAVKMPTGAHDKHHTRKRRHSSSSTPTHYTDGDDSHSKSNDADVSESESDDVDITLTSRPPPATNKRPRYRLADSRDDGAAAAPSATTSPVQPSRRKENRKGIARGGGLKSKTFTAQDARAAKLLLDLHLHDQKLSNGPNGPVKVPERSD